MSEQASQEFLLKKIQELEEKLDRAPEGAVIIDTERSKLNSLKNLSNSFLDSPMKFKRGDIVRWKNGLKNKKYPREGQYAYVIEELDTPKLDETKDSGSPYFLEPLNLLLAFLGDKDELLTFYYDKRRFEIVDKA